MFYTSYQCCMTYTHIHIHTHTPLLHVQLAIAQHDKEAAFAAIASSRASDADIVRTLTESVAVLTRQAAAEAQARSGADAALAMMREERGGWLETMAAENASLEALFGETRGAKEALMGEEQSIYRGTRGSEGGSHG